MKRRQFKECSPLYWGNGANQEEVNLIAPQKESGSRLFAEKSARIYKVIQSYAKLSHAIKINIQYIIFPSGDGLGGQTMPAGPSPSAYSAGRWSNEHTSTCTPPKCKLKKSGKYYCNYCTGPYIPANEANCSLAVYWSADA